MSEIVEAILKMKRAIEESKQILYYATNDDIPEGDILFAEENDYHPRFIVFNSKRIQHIKSELVGVRLVHLRDYMPTVDDLLKPFRLTPLRWQPCRATVRNYPPHSLSTAVRRKPLR